jgi:hypothetical protein
MRFHVYALTVFSQCMVNLRIVIKTAVRCLTEVTLVYRMHMHLLRCTNAGALA